MYVLSGGCQAIGIHRVSINWMDTSSSLMRSRGMNSGLVKNRQGVLLARVQSVPRHVTSVVVVQSARTFVCKRCKKRYKESENSETACRYHPLNWSGGEKAKAIGFLRESDAPEHSLAQVHGTGMLQFWDCCGQTSYSSSGCCISRHVPYGTETDDDLFS